MTAPDERPVRCATCTHIRRAVCHVEGQIGVPCDFGAHLFAPPAPVAPETLDAAVKAAREAINARIFAGTWAPGGLETEGVLRDYREAVEAAVAARVRAEGSLFLEVQDSKDEATYNANRADIAIARAEAAERGVEELRAALDGLLDHCTECGAVATWSQYVHEDHYYACDEHREGLHGGHIRRIDDEREVAARAALRATPTPAPKEKN